MMPIRALTILLAVVIVMVDGFDLQAIGFLAPEIARSWGVEIAAFGPVFSAALFGSMIGAMAAGPVARKISVRWVLILSLLVFGCGTLITAWVGDITTLTILRFIVGLGLGAAVPALMTVVAANSSPRFRSTLVVMTLCGQPIGAIVGAALCAHYIPIYGWPFAFHLGGTIPLLLILAVASLPREVLSSNPMPEPVADTAKADRWRDLFSTHLRTTTLLLWSCTFLGAFLAYIIVNWLPASLRAVGYTLEDSVWAISLFNFGSIGGALLMGALIDRFGPFKVMPVAFTLGGLALAMLDVSRSTQPLLLTFSFISGLAAYGGVMTLGPLSVMMYPPALRTTGVGWVMGVGRLGAAIGPLGAGLALTAGLAIGRLFYFAAGAAIIVTLCLVTLSRSEPARIAAANRKK